MLFRIKNRASNQFSPRSKSFSQLLQFTLCLLRNLFIRLNNGRFKTLNQKFLNQLTEFVHDIFWHCLLRSVTFWREYNIHNRNLKYSYCKDELLKLKLNKSTVMPGSELKTFCTHTYHSYPYTRTTRYKLLVYLTYSNIVSGTYGGYILYRNI